MHIGYSMPLYMQGWFTTKSEYNIKLSSCETDADCSKYKDEFALLVGI